MILGRIGETVFDDFTVNDFNNSPVAGLIQSDFTWFLYDPNDDSYLSTDSTSSVPVTIIELGHGNYRSKFDPDVVGTWYLVVRQSLYFPWGKANNIQVYANDFDDIASSLARALGLMQDNYSMDNTIYNDDGNLISARIRLYDNKDSIGTDEDIIGVYSVTAIYDGCRLDDYKVARLL